MKSKLTKVMSAVFMAAVISCTSIAASADSSMTSEAQTNAVSSIGSGGISPLATDPPNNAIGSGITSLPYTAEPYPIYAGYSCYTLHYFKTTTGKLTLDYSLYAVQPSTGKRNVIFELLEGKNGFLWDVNWTSVDLKSISFEDTVDEGEGGIHKTYDDTVTFRGLKNNTMYCIRIVNTTKEDPTSGYNHENAVCGKIVIKE